jgi:hypothetical protein
MLETTRVKLCLVINSKAIANTQTRGEMYVCGKHARLLFRVLNSGCMLTTTRVKMYVCGKQASFLYHISEMIFNLMNIIL